MLIVTGLVLTSVLGCGDDDDTERVCEQLDVSSRQAYIRDYQYLRYRIFDLARIGGVTYWGAGDAITSFRVFQSATTSPPDEYYPLAVAYPNSLDPSASPDSVRKRFRELDFGEDYIIDPNKFYIYFPKHLQDIQSTVVAYHMVVVQADGDTLTFGDITGAEYRLQLLKRMTPMPDDLLWDAEWRNIYDLKSRDLDYPTLDIDIFKGVLGDEMNPANLDHQDGMTSVVLLGLDSVGGTGLPPPDGRVDDDPSILYLKEGLLIFPSRQPFASESLDDAALLYESPNPYDLRDSSKYYLSVRIRPSRNHRLDHIQLIDGSETVTLDGQQLSRGNHYEIDYVTGEIWLLNSDVLDSADVLQVCYEYTKWSY